MFSGSLTVFVVTGIVMLVLIGAGVVGGIAMSRVRMKRFLKVFNEDVKRPAYEKLSN
jgi:hypothetical protein